VWAKQSAVLGLLNAEASDLLVQPPSKRLNEIYYFYVPHSSTDAWRSVSTQRRTADLTIHINAIKHLYTRRIQFSLSSYLAALVTLVQISTKIMTFVLQKGRDFLKISLLLSLINPPWFKVPEI
jgi:hypothetical protein